ncbi:MAG: hypothetical protein QXX30_00290 [Candidatus Aenigmatarchaeota archaeon]
MQIEREKKRFEKVLSILTDKAQENNPNFVFNIKNTEFSFYVIAKRYKKIETKTKTKYQSLYRFTYLPEIMDFGLFYSPEFSEYNGILDFVKRNIYSFLDIFEIKSYQIQDFLSTLKEEKYILIRTPKKSRIYKQKNLIDKTKILVLPEDTEELILGYMIASFMKKDYIHGTFKEAEETFYEHFYLANYYFVGVVRKFVVNSIL